MLNEKIIREIVESVINDMNIKDQDDIKPENIQNLNDDEIKDITSDEFKNKILVKNPKDIEALRQFKAATPARLGAGRAGDRPMTETLLRFRADHAAAIDSVFSEVSDEALSGLDLVKLKTRVASKDEYITRPDLGRLLDDESMRILKEKCIKNPEIQIVISDGLSSKAIEANIKDILPAFIQGLNVYNIKVGTPVFVKYGRVGVMDDIGEALGAKAAVLFVGERPGLATAESMSAYMVYAPKNGIEEARRTVVSNIHRRGTPPVEAGAHIATIMNRILNEKASGVYLEK